MTKKVFSSVLNAYVSRKGEADWMLFVGLRFWSIYRLTSKCLEQTFHHHLPI